MAGNDEPLTPDTGTAVAERAGITLTNPDKVLYEAPRIAKAGLAAYYDRVAPRLLAHAADRPLSFLRCPDGQSGKCFFQKHDQGGFADALGRVPIAERSGANETYFYLRNAAGLFAAVQMGVLEFHIWGARRNRLEHPDRLVFDLDPDADLDFGRVTAAAIAIRDRLADLGLTAFAMVTGGKGVHVVAPLTRRRAWPDVKAFARGLAKTMADDAPDRFTISTARADRHDRILIDFLRNDFGQTAIAPYATRARDGAPVATPVGWDELAGLDRANGFAPQDVATRLKDPDPWAGYGRSDQSVTDKMLRTVETA